MYANQPLNLVNIIFISFLEARYTNVYTIQLEMNAKKEFKVHWYIWFNNVRFNLHFFFLNFNIVCFLQTFFSRVNRCIRLPISIIGHQNIMFEIGVRLLKKF